MRIFFIGIVLSLLPLCASGQKVDPMTKAVLEAYNDILRDDPSDYTTLYQRAMQYYRLQQYTLALDDVERALRLTPASEKDLKSREYGLMASVYAMLQKYDKAIESVRAALQINPNDLELNYRMGEFCLLANDVQSAKKAFLAMQKINRHSPEAMLGLARVDIAQGNWDEAMQKMQYAEDLNSSLWTTSQSIGDLLVLLGQPQQAAASYIKAIAQADGQPMPLESLLKLADTNYIDVKAAIEDAMSKSRNTVSIPLLLGNVAFQTGHYNDAAAALRKVLTFESGRQPGIYNLLAECLLAQGRTAEAIDNASRAITIRPQVNYYCVKARAQRVAGDLNAALATIDNALADNPDDTEALVERALILDALSKYSEAIAALEKVFAGNPDDPYARILAGAIHDKLNDGKSTTCYMIASRSDASTPALTAMKGLAQLMSGKVLDGDATLRDMLKTESAENCYWAAVAYMNAGEKARAGTLAARAKELGFENIYLLDEATGPFTLRP